MRQRDAGNLPEYLKLSIALIIEKKEHSDGQSN